MIETASYVIRPVMLEDLPKCLPFGQAFMTEKQVPGRFSPETFLKAWTSFLASGQGIIYGLWNGEDLAGGLGGFVYPDLNTGETCAIEAFWYVGKDDRGTTWPVRLVHAFRKWGKKHGATRFRMIHLLMEGEDPSTVKLAGYYQKIGLRPIEVVYDGTI